jgi:hypothetical protein
LIPLIRRFGSRPPLLAGLSLLLAGLSLPLPLRAQEPPEDFGRWQRDVSRCQLGRGPGRAIALDCETVRLDQQLPGLLSVRFFNRGRGSSPTQRLLVFAGILERGSRPMTCRAGSCQWSSGMRARVSVLADLGISPAGNATSSLPMTRLTQGSCLLLATRIRCEARAEGEGTWWAQADL